LDCCVIRGRKFYCLSRLSPTSAPSNNISSQEDERTTAAAATGAGAALDDWRW
jgi:hypothetical protein